MKVLRDFSFEEIPELSQKSYSHQICGCCGAGFTKNLEEFNSPTELKLSWDTTNHEDQKNRGILFGLNLNEDGITKNTPKTLRIDKVQIGEHTLHIKLRVHDES